MRIPALTREVAYAATQLVDADRPPSHDELTRLFRGVGLLAADPGPGHGKVKRMRAVMDHALAHDKAAGARLASRLLQTVRGAGGFRSGSPVYVGEEIYVSLRDAYRAVGYELDPDGELRPRLLEHVPASESDEVLRTYVRRIRQGVTDAPLVTGSGKDLLEATARRIVDKHGGAYAGKDFPGTLYHAFLTLDLPGLTPDAVERIRSELDSDPRARLMQVLYLLGCEVNRLRNAEGTGHGRPFPASVTDLEGRLAAQSMALVSELLLAVDDGQPAAQPSR